VSLYAAGCFLQGTNLPDVRSDINCPANCIAEAPSPIISECMPVPALSLGLVCFTAAAADVLQQTDAHAGER